MKKSYCIKLDEFEGAIITKLTNKASKSKTRSKYYAHPVLKIPKDSLFICGREIVEMSEIDLIDEYGHLYNFNVLTTLELCELADKLLK
jgi:hypothetical protein